MYWEERKEWDKAIDCYKKGLEADDLVEEFYRRIILCHQRLGRNAEALSAYNRCKKILAAYGVELSPETEEIRRDLVGGKR
jgi:two-component SAPR family response regulator